MEKNRIRALRSGDTTRISYSKINEVLEMPNLIEVQKDSYQWFLDEGLKEVFKDVSGITDYTGNLVLDFVDYKLDVDGIGLDFLEGKQSAKLVTEQGFPNDKILFAGVVNGKNIWKNHYDKTLSLLAELSQHAEQIVLNTSCSLLHVPYTTANEHKLSEEVLSHFAYAAEKLTELNELKQILSADHPQETAAYQKNAALFATPRSGANKSVQEQVAALKDADFVRLPAFAEREQIQKKTFGLPLLPTTTIGSFPQTAAV